MTEKERTALIGLLASIAAGASIGALLNYAIKGKISWAAPILGALAGAAAKYGYDWYKDSAKPEDKVTPPLPSPPEASVTIPSTREETVKRFAEILDRPEEAVQQAIAKLEDGGYPVIVTNVERVLGDRAIPNSEPSAWQRPFTEVTNKVESADFIVDLAGLGLGAASWGYPRLKPLGGKLMPINKLLGFGYLGSALLGETVGGVQNALGGLNKGPTNASDAWASEYESWLEDPANIYRSLGRRTISGVGDTLGLYLLKRAPHSANLPVMFAAGVTGRRPMQGVNELISSGGFGLGMLGENYQHERAKGNSRWAAARQAPVTWFRQLFTPGAYMEQDTEQPGVDYKLYNSLIQQGVGRKDAIKQAEQSWIAANRKPGSYRSTEIPTQRADIDWGAYNYFRDFYTSKGAPPATARKLALINTYEHGGVTGGKLQMPTLSDTEAAYLK